MSDQIINKVAKSALKTFDLEEFYTPGERLILDIKDQLYEGLILKEKDFREYIKSNDWSIFQGKHVAIQCTAEAIIPTWAYMLLTVALEPYAKSIIFGSLEELEIQIFKTALDKVDWSVFQDGKVVIKGCSKVKVPIATYVYVTNRLRPLASSIMFGEPCSTVPIYKKLKA